MNVGMLLIEVWEGDFCIGDIYVTIYEQYIDQWHIIGHMLKIKIMSSCTFNNVCTVFHNIFTFTVLYYISLRFTILSLRFTIFDVTKYIWCFDYVWQHFANISQCFIIFYKNFTIFDIIS